MLKASRGLDVNDGCRWRLGYSQLHKLRRQRLYRGWQRVGWHPGVFALGRAVASERFAFSNQVGHVRLHGRIVRLCRRIRLAAGFSATGTQGNHQQRDGKPRRVESHGHVVEKAELYFGSFAPALSHGLQPPKPPVGPGKLEGNEPSQL